MSPKNAAIPGEKSKTGCMNGRAPGPEDLGLGYPQSETGYVTDRNWRLIVSEPASGAWNMAVDEAIMKVYSRRLVPPTLRLYTWEPPCVSIGYFQDAEAEIDIDACHREGADVVRRATGGRAVLHEDEVTYSVVIGEDALPGSVLQTYMVLSRGLLEGLRILGVKAELAPGRSASSGGSTSACFDAPSFYEIVVDGKKAVGSAQTRKCGVILQHGSIPTVFDASKVARLLGCKDEAERNRIERILRRKATGLYEALGREVPFESIMEAVIEGFRRGLHLELTKQPLTALEEEIAQHLYEKKYSTPEWNIGRITKAEVCR